MSQCNAYELLYWDTDRDCVGWKQTIGRQLADDQRDVKWHSWSSTLGFDVLGIWPPDYDNTDINMVARSHEVKGYGRYVACATDFGGVLLFEQRCHARTVRRKAVPHDMWDRRVI